MHSKLAILPVLNIPLIQEGDDLAALIADAVKRQGLQLEDGDVLVVAQKIISKAEGRLVSLAGVQPTEAAIQLAGEIDKDPRLVELILQESSEIVRKAPGVIIARHRLGYVTANAGIDQSNIDHADGENALLLPLDPDQSARRVRKSLGRSSGKQLGVIVSDSANRPWRLGTLGFAIGSAGITVLDDRRMQTDLFGRELKVTMSNRADAIAAAAALVMGETTERVPVAVVRGFPAEDSYQTARDCIRPLAEDLFR
jgi:coenzyme F420-0:L-glutamate ligase/coenzyme F420-1:gamma-L-glutamate ligase